MRPKMLALAAMGLSFTAPAMAQSYQTVEIYDRNGFERPVVAYRTEVPASWTFQGGITWDANEPCIHTNQKMRIEARDPQSGLMIRGEPAEAWSWASVYQQMGTPPGTRSSGCILAPPTDAANYLQMAVRNLRPGAQIVNVSPNPKLLQLAQSTAGGMAQFSAAEVVAHYQMNGQPVREVFHAAVGNTRQPMPDMYGGMSGYMTTSFTMGIASMTGPQSGFDTTPLVHFWSSMKPDQAYQQRMMQHQRKMAGIAARGANQRAQDSAAAQARLNQTLNETSDIIANGYQERSAIQDAGVARMNDANRGVTAYQNQYGEHIEAPSQYDRAYEMEDGSYIATDDPSFEPAWGTQMEEYDYEGN